MDKSFGEGYISKIKNQQVEQIGDEAIDTNSANTITIAGDVALGQLKKVLLVLNGSMLLVIPGLAWLLTERTLRPVEKTYNKQKQFVSDASHELRTPLTIMLGELDVTLKKVRTPKEYQAAIKSTREEVHSLHQLTEELLLLSRNDQPQVKEPVDLVDLLTETISHLLPLAAQKNIEVVFDPPNKAIEITGSATMLRQLFTNLLDNAIKFTSKNGRVTLNIKQAEKNVRIIITDNGIGMTDQEASQAFERFYRADTARRSKGFGLGLAISKAIVEQHHSSIAISSKQNIGTTVIVDLLLTTR